MALRGKGWTLTEQVIGGAIAMQPFIKSRLLPCYTHVKLNSLLRSGFVQRNRGQLGVLWRILPEGTAYLVTARRPRIEVMKGRVVG